MDLSLDRHCKERSGAAIQSHKHRPFRETLDRHAAKLLVTMKRVQWKIVKNRLRTIL